MALLFSLVGTIVLLDQLTKLLVLDYLPVNTGKVIIPGFFNLVHVRNTGMAFSLLAGQGSTWRQAFFMVTTLVVLGILFSVYRKLRHDDYWTKTAYALVCGGAGGNLIDRAFRSGEVIDFLDLYVGSYHWPAFNVADSAISIGAVMLAVTLFRKE